MKKYWKVLLGLGGLTATSIALVVPLVSCSKNFLYIEGWVDDLQRWVDSIDRPFVEKMRVVKVNENGEETTALEHTENYNIFIGSFKTWAYKNQKEIVDNIKNNNVTYVVQYWDYHGINSNLNKWKDILILDIYF